MKLREEAPWLASGFLLMLFSGFGQTYYIALFAGHIKSELILTDGQFGGLYTVGTLASATLLTWAGRFADTIAIRWLGMGVIAGLALTSLAMASVTSPWMLAFLLFGLRFFGQGMCTHTSMTAMGRWFNRNRGRAVSLAGLGLPASEGLMPLAAVASMALIGWRGTWVASAVLLLLLGLPALYFLLRHERHPTRGPGQQADDAPEENRTQWTRGEVLAHPLFYALLPGVLAPPFIITAVFFNQVTLVEIRGWQLEWFAASFPVLAAVHVAAALLAGWMVDRFGAHRLLSVFLGTMGLGVMLLAVTESKYILPVVMALFGVTMGFAGTVSGALWAELYGTLHLGAIRSVITAIMVFSTAIAPGLVGLLLDAGVQLELQLLVMAIYSFAAVFWVVYLIPRMDRLVNDIG